MPRSRSVRDDTELRPLTEDASLDRAFELAHSIYRFRARHRETALRIVREALSGVSVRLVAQREADRHDPFKPSKVRWNTLQWFQLLLYCKSEPFEWLQETSDAGSLTQEDMVVRYVKHLVLTTARRNSFHMALGLSRLLYDYTTAESMAVYDLAFQDPDVSTRKADAYYRGRKNRLIDELARRFGPLLSVEQGPRGSRRFRTRDDSGRFAALVAEYLTRFSPWGVGCALPTPLDTWSPVSTLRGSQASQIHALIHPPCFSRLVTALKFDPPERRLALPLFFLPQHEADGGDGVPSPLTRGEADSIRQGLEEEVARRRKFTPQSLCVLIDGAERARFEPSLSGGIRLEVPGEATLVELVGVDTGGELILAAHVLTPCDEDERRSEEFSVVLEGGQKITLLVSRDVAGDGNSENCLIEVRYEQSAAAALTAWRLFRSLLAPPPATARWYAPLISPKAAVAFAALALAALALYLLLAPRTRPPEEIARREQPTSTPQAAVTPAPSPGASAPAHTSPAPTPARRPPDANVPRPPEVTRDGGERAVVSLGDVGRLYVGSLGEDAFGRAVRQKLIVALRERGVFPVTENSEEADAALTGAARSAGSRRERGGGREAEVGSATVEVVNVSGRVLWRGRRVTGTADEVAARLAKELLAAARAGGRRSRP